MNSVLVYEFPLTHRFNYHFVNPINQSLYLYEIYYENNPTTGEIIQLYNILKFEIQITHRPIKLFS